MVSAHSTAVTAAMRRLSEAAHSQTPLGWLASGDDRDLNIALSCSVHVGGSVFGSVRDVDMLPGQGLRNAFDVRRLFEFDVNREGVSVKDGSLHQQQRWDRSILAGNPLIMFQDAALVPWPAPVPNVRRSGTPC